MSLTQCDQTFFEKSAQILSKYRPKWSLSKYELLTKEISGQNLGILRQQVA
jgi:hypothetical protein